jgi:hypothetical protein
MPMIPTTTADDTPHRNDDLLVTFRREGQVEATHIVNDGEKALMAAERMLSMQDALRAGDSITVDWHKRPTVIEQGVA